MRVLLSSSSRHGATTEVLEMIARVLRERAISVEVLDPAEVGDLSRFDAAVLGSAVYLGHWLAPEREFVERHREELARIPVWLFSVGPVGNPPLPSGGPSEVPGLMRSTGAREHMLFAGRLDAHRLKRRERLFTAMLHVPDGDWRDWAHIERWAADIADSLLAQAEQGP